MHAGVSIVAGTDSNGGSRVFQEMGVLAECGLSAPDARRHRGIIDGFTDP